VVLSIFMAGGYAALSKRWVPTVTWLALTGVLGATGVLARFELPPRMFFLLLPALALTIWVGWRGDLHTLPLALLIGFQAFRVPVELLIHQAVVEGLAPPQMTWTGMNWDILTGASALLVGPLASRLLKAVLHLWNVLGFGLLLNVLVVAILSMPTPFQMIEPDNTWIAHFPYVWLPTVLVLAALLGHVVLLRKLTRSP
jgi:hypothetical protein